MTDIYHFKVFYFVVLMWQLIQITCISREFTSGFLLYSYRGFILLVLVFPGCTLQH
jgi:hypothetical protein